MREFDIDGVFQISGYPAVICDIDSHNVTYIRCGMRITHSIELFVSLVN